MSGGGARSLMRLNRPDGNTQHNLPGHRIVGNHKGDYADCNLVDPRPGTVHQLGVNKPANILAAKSRGWWVADPQRDGRLAHELTDRTDTGVPLDTAGGPHGLVHLVTTEENYRRLQKEQQEASQQALNPLGDRFLDSVSAGEASTGRGANGMTPTRFAIRGHGTTLMEGDQVRAQLTPNGVLREEF